MKAAEGGKKLPDGHRPDLRDEPKGRDLSMKWLRLHGRVHRTRMTSGRAGTGPAPEPRNTRLVLLTHDASGPGAYRLHTFENAQSAEEFVQFWFPGTAHHGILAFWAMHAEPAGQDEEHRTEAAILIRDEARLEIVYPFSIPDMEMAYAWIARETAQGLDLRHVLVYWAAPVRISRDQRGRVRLTPTQPPTAREAESPAGAPALDEVDQEGRRDQKEAAGPGQADRSRDLLAEIEAIAAAAMAEHEPDAPLDEAHGGEGAAAMRFTAALEEFSRSLRMRRWRRHRGPFRGFDSPRGKF